MQFTRKAIAFGVQDIAQKIVCSNFSITADESKIKSLIRADILKSYNIDVPEGDDMVKDATSFFENEIAVAICDLAASNACTGANLNAAKKELCAIAGYTNADQSVCKDLEELYISIVSSDLKRLECTLSR